MKQVISPLFQVGICAVGYLSTTSSATLAQVTSDGTVNTQVNQNGSIAEITGGETRDSNLFHSFQDFSVGTGNEAFFNNADSVSNIFSRVTGGNISNIDGLIRNNGSANLFLINPAGIIFGENARLDIGGSFYGSTASSILFEDGEFSAADLENPPLLTVNAPIGLGFRDNPGDIVNRSDLANVETVETKFLNPEVAAAVFNIFNPDSESSRFFADDIPLEADERFVNGEGAEDILLDLGIITEDDFITETFESVTPIGLQVGEGKDFALIGGNVSIKRSAITAPGGRVTLGGISQAGIIDFNENGSFTFPENTEKADITIGGDFALETINPDTVLESEVPDSTSEVSGGSIELQARDLILDGASIGLTLNEESPANSIVGSVNLNARTISMENSGIDITSFGETLGDVSLSADSISLSDSFISLTGFELGTVGNINLNADSVSLSNSSISLTGFELGTVGNFNINASSISITDFSFIELMASGMEAKVGDINIDSDFFELDNSPIVLFALGENTNAGDINLTSNSIELSNSGVDVFVGEGTVGDINLTANSIELNNDSYLLSRIAEAFNVEGRIESGMGGDINLTANSISLTDLSSIISDSSQSGGEGIIGNINIDTGSILIADQASIQTQTEEIEASNIDINATESIEVNGLNSSISSQTGGVGNSGGITFTTSELNIFNGGQVSANNFITESFEISPEGILIRNILEQPQEGSGNAGTIEITANNINLKDRGGIVALSSAGEGGNINLRVDDILSLRGNSEISATAGELDTPGNGGNINIDSQFIIAFLQGNNDITANAFDGDGGNITIGTEGIFGIEERSRNPLTNDITASSNAGISGNITITTPDINPVQGAIELPINVVTPEETSQQACEANREAAAKNGLNITGKGGILPEPGLPLNSLNVTVNGETNPTSTIPAPIQISQGKIQPARGIKVTESGEVILTAYRTNNSGDRISGSSRNCGRV